MNYRSTGLPLPARHERLETQLVRLGGPDARFWQALAAAEDMASDGDWNLAVTAAEMVLHEARLSALEARANEEGRVR